jgi:hypothetical protein
MKTPRLLWISISLAIILSACNLPTQTADQNLVGTYVAMTLQANSIQTTTGIATLIYTLPAATASPLPSSIPPNTPAWLAYNYTCELADGGGDMTMNLAWDDRSSSEEGYKVYRDGQVIATLEPNSTFYVDIAFVAMGKTLSYKVEAFTADWQLSTSTIAYGCQ